jgi:hypothetical protein
VIDAASLVGVVDASSYARSVTDVGMEEKGSTRMRKVMAVAQVVAVVAAGVGWQKAAEDQLGPCPSPALMAHQELELCGADRCLFGLGKRCYLERRKPVPGSESNWNRDSGVSGVREQATFP